MSDANDRPTWANDFVAQDQAGATGEQRVAVLARIAELARVGAWDEIGSAISNLPVSEMREGGLITMVRGTFRFREKLPGWDDLRQQVEAELNARKADTPRLLMGI